MFNNANPERQIKSLKKQLLQAFVLAKVVVFHSSPGMSSSSRYCGLNECKLNTVFHMILHILAA